jgi:hypothetical protein
MHCHTTAAVDVQNGFESFHTVYACTSPLTAACAQSNDQHTRHVSSLFTAFSGNPATKYDAATNQALAATQKSGGDFTIAYAQDDGDDDSI